MKYIFPTIMLSGGIYFLANGQAFAGMLLLWLSWYTYSEGK